MQNNYDSEFYFNTICFQHGTCIELASLALIYKDGRKFYAINSDLDYSKSNDFYSDLIIESEDSNIIKKSKSLIDIEGLLFIMKCVGYENVGYSLLDIDNNKINSAIYNKLLSIIKANPSKLSKIKWIGLNPSFDWVCISSLFGGERKMVELGVSTNYVCLRQTLDCKNINVKDLEKSFPYTNDITSLNNAEWIKTINTTINQSDFDNQIN